MRPTTRARVRAQALGAVAIAAAMVLAVQASPAPTTTAFTDHAVVASGVTGYTVPLAVMGAVEISGTGEYISSRLNVTCDAPSGAQWRWRDHMVVWGSYWNGWSEWTDHTDQTGWTGWSTSDLTIANLDAEVQWEVRCGASTWTSTAQLHDPVTIVRTT